MANYVYEIVKEYVLIVEGLEHSVKGRILRQIDNARGEKYSWDISHHYRPSKEAATVYIPSKINTESLEEAEKLLLGYMRSFTTINVTPNGFY